MTAHSELVYRSFDFQPFNFIPKSSTDELNVSLYIEAMQIRQKYCLDFYNDTPNVKNVAEAYKYAEEITLRNIPFMLEYYKQVKNVDDMIAFLDSKIELNKKYSSSYYSYYEYYEKSFLLAYKKQMDEAIDTMKKIHPDIVDDAVLKRLQKAYDLET